MQKYICELRHDDGKIELVSLTLFNLWDESEMFDYMIKVYCDTNTVELFRHSIESYGQTYLWDGNNYVNEDADCDDDDRYRF